MEELTDDLTTNNYARGSDPPPQSSTWICTSFRTSPGVLFFISKMVVSHAIAGCLTTNTFALWTLLSKWLAKWSYALKRLLVALTAIRIPERVHLQAMQVLLRYRRKRIYARRMRRTGYLSLKVNPRWRLLSKDDGRNWEVMSHEKYSGEIKR